MSITNSASKFGWISIILHWVIAITTLGLFVLGWWMVDLDYYSEWYQLAPWWHKGLGVLVFILVIKRWLWQFYSPSPEDLPSIPSWQNTLAHLVHGTLNLLIVALAVTGYLMVTAKGQDLIVFDIVIIPALIDDIPQLEDTTGQLHWYFALSIIALAAIHALAAIKHHMIDKDITLKRMLRHHQEEV